MELKDNQFFLKILTNDFTNHIRKAINEDLDPVFNKQYSDEAPHIDGFLSLYINDLKLSSSDLIGITSINNSYNNESTISLISRILTSPYSVFIKNRQDWIDIFEDSLEDNFMFFKETFSQLLNVNYSPIKYRAGDDFEQYNQKNIDFLKDLIKIGHRKNYFKNFSEKELLTANEDFFSILKDEKVINVEFKPQQLVDHILSNDTEPFISSFFYDIAALSKEEIHEVLHEIHTKSLEDDKDSKLKNFFELLFKQIPNDILIYQKNDNPSADKVAELKKQREDNTNYAKALEFFENVMSYENSPNYMISVNTFKNYIVNFPDSFNEFLKIAEYKINYTINEQDETFERRQSSNNIVNILKDLIDTTNVHFDKDMSKIFTNVLNLIQNNARPGNYYYGFNSSNSDRNKINVPSNLSGLFLAKYYSIHNFTTKTEKDNHELYSFFRKNINIINNIFNCGTFPFFISQKTALAINSKEFLNTEENAKFLNKINADMHVMLYNVVKNEYINTDSEKKLTALSSYILNSKNVEPLDILNFSDDNSIWTTPTIRDRKNNLPLAFYILENSNGAALPWFLKKNNIDDFMALTFKNKNFLHYLKDKPYFYNIFIEISKNADAFDKIFNQNKSNTNLIKKIAENSNIEEHKENIISILEYQQLSKKFNSKKTEEVVKPRSSIQKI